MIEIWQEYSNYQTTSQRLADQVSTIIKKGWFSDLEIIEIHQKKMIINVIIHYLTHQILTNNTDQPK